MSKERYLVLHDYGTGGLWWWIHARSTREVLETFAEVEVVDDPADVVRAEGWQLAEVDIDASAMPAGQLPDQEIDRDEFEGAWAAARWENGRKSAT